MEKLLPLIVIGVLILSGFGVIGTNIDISYKSLDNLIRDNTLLYSLSFPNVDEFRIINKNNMQRIEIDDFNFFKANSYQPQRSSKEGIFLCGTCREPMDIPNSVIDASGAAAKAAEIVMRG